MRRIAISNRRISSIKEGQVRFRYEDWSANDWNTTTLLAEEFIRRHLQHVLPKGFHKVRLYGLLAPGNRFLLQWAAFFLSTGDDPTSEDSDYRVEPPIPVTKGLPICPHCGVGRLIPVGRLLPGERGPP